jgi:hypothetical protein
LLHLLWCGEVTADLGQVLDGATILWRTGKRAA